jgi:hypothetical protein
MLQSIWEVSVTLFAYGIFIPALEHPLETDVAITVISLLAVWFNYKHG